jgi:hypothetical protein
MEILRFEQAPSDAPKRKKSSRSFLALGLVATLFGVSTAFASSTIQINGTANLVALGQGVATVSGCDTDITVTPNKDENGFQLLDDTAPKFVLKNIVLDNVDTNPEGYDADNPGQGCYTKDLQVQVFRKVPGDPALQLTCTQLGAAAFDLVNITDDRAYPDPGAKDSAKHLNDSKCVDGSIYFRVWSKAGTAQPVDSKTAAYTINLSDGTADFDYITIVSTQNIDYTRP